MTTNADRHRERIAELRRLARLAQGREPDEETSSAAPARRWEPDIGIRFTQVGPGIQVLTPEEAARRLKLSTREVLAKVDLSQLVGLARIIPLSEVERENEPPGLAPV
jgi:hypothetical protein